MSGRALRAICTAAALAAVVVASPATAVPAEPSPTDPGPVTADASPAPSAPAAPLPEDGTGEAGVDQDSEEEAAGAEETTGDADTGKDAGEPGTVDASEAFAGGTGAATGGAPNVSALLTELQRLYQRAEEAAEKYNGTAEELEKRTARAKKLSGELTRARLALDASRTDAGRLAREQYQGRSDLSAYLRLLLSDDPSRALDQGHLIERAAAGRAAAVDRFTGAERRAGRLATAARAALDEQRALTARRKKERDAAEARLKEVEARLAALSAGQLAQVSALERRNVEGAQGELVASGALSATRTPSRRGGEAVRYAIGQIGKPYVWGAEGPDSFDCSGLTSRAWSHAGLEVPRTSQEQWAKLRRVPVSALRPGDLVVYFPKATHVALYIGNGLVVQAPRPGTRVKVSPVASNPLLGAVRPDPEGEPLRTYTPPPLPRGASDGSDTGYAAQEAPED